MSSDQAQYWGGPATHGPRQHFTGVRYRALTLLAHPETSLRRTNSAPGLSHPSPIVLGVEELFHSHLQTLPGINSHPRLGKHIPKSRPAPWWGQAYRFDFINTFWQRVLYSYAEHHCWAKFNCLLKKPSCSLSRREQVEVNSLVFFPIT